MSVQDRRFLQSQSKQKNSEQQDLKSSEQQEQKSSQQQEQKSSVQYESKSDEQQEQRSSEQHDSSRKHWSYKINVLQSSTRTSSVRSYPVLTEQSEKQSESESEHSSNTSLDESDSLIDWGSDSTWPDVILPGTWGIQALEEIPWNDKNRPYIRSRKYEDLQLTELESKGILTDRILAACSSYLDRSPVTEKYVLCKANLSKKLLNDISIISYHHYLQYIDLSWNELSSVEELGQLPFLMYIDVSHNMLTKVLDFKAPFNLTYVNYSHNMIQKIGNLSKFWSLVNLDLSHNNITVIEGLQELKYLRHLNLSFNAIECIEHLNHMRLLTLDLQHNNILKFEEGENVGFKTLTDILRINLGYNYLNTLKLFVGIPGLQAINVSDNFIDDLMEITYLRGLNYLSEVEFRGNPITTAKYYINVCLDSIKYLCVLDGEFMDAERKVLVKSSYESSPNMEAIKKSAKILFLQQLNDPFIGPPIIPADQRTPPIIILVGPPGSKKGSFLQTFLKENPKYATLAVSHTTRSITEEEVNENSYYFITRQQFQEMAHEGQFLTASVTLGQYFGLAQSEIAKAVGKRTVLLLHMDLTGALTLRAKGFRCRLVLTMSSTADVHRQWLMEKYYNGHEDSQYVGAMEIENCPTKAKQFLHECDTLSRSSGTSVAKGIVNELVDSIMKSASEGVESSNNSSENFGEGSVSSIKLSEESPCGSGILKTPVNIQSKANYLSNTQRFSVGFHNQTSSILGAHARTQSYRSVTFSEDISEYSRPTQPSASGTVVHGPEPENELLSVLSRARVPEHKERMATCLRTWNIQSETLKAVVDEIIDSRNTYLDVHYSNPGLFCEVIFTDDSDEAEDKLIHLLKKCVAEQPNTTPHYQYQKDVVYHTLLATRLASLHHEINSQMSTMQNQLDAIGHARQAELLNKASQAHVITQMEALRHDSASYNLPTIATRKSNQVSRDSLYESAEDL